MSLLRVTAHMASPLAGAQHDLHLDGVLLAASPGIRGDKAPITRSTPLAEILYPPVPIATIRARGHWVYACSGLEHDGRPGLERLTKRRDPTDTESLAANYSARSGPGRNYCLPIPTIETPTCSWLVIGRRRGILELLRYVKQLGSIRRQGYGVVTRWTAEHEERDPVEVLVRDGRARRYMPAEWTAGADWTRGPTRPPYWHPALSEPRVVPGQPCELRPEVVAAVSTLR